MILFTRYLKQFYLPRGSFPKDFPNTKWKAWQNFEIFHFLEFLFPFSSEQQHNYFEFSKSTLMISNSGNHFGKISRKLHWLKALENCCWRMKRFRKYSENWSAIRFTFAYVALFDLIACKQDLDQVSSFSTRYFSRRIESDASNEWCLVQALDNRYIRPSTRHEGTLSVRTVAAALTWKLFWSHS